MDNVPPPAAAPAPAQYEFDGDQNKVIEQLADNLDGVRFFSFLLSLIFTIKAVKAVLRAVRTDVTDPQYHTVVTYGVVAVVFGVFATYLHRGAEALRQVVRTAGYDVTHLMAGLRGVSGFFGTVRTLYGLAGAALIVVFVLSLFRVI